MKLLHFPPTLRNQNWFYLEQWMALLIGIVCLGVSAWAAWAGFGDSSGNTSAGQSALPTLKCSLTVAVAIIGTTLVRFAFYKPGKPSATNPVSPGQERIPQQDAKGDTSRASTPLKSIAVHKARG